MRAAGRRHPYIFLLLIGIAASTSVAIAAGFVGVGAMADCWPPRLQAFGAGALVAMTAETMIPEAFHDRPPALPIRDDGVDSATTAPDTIVR